MTNSTRTLRTILAGGAALAVGIGAGMVLTGAVSAEAETLVPQNEPAEFFSAEEYDAKALTADGAVELPSAMRDSEVGRIMEPATVRLLHSADGSSIFTGLDDHGQICMVIFLEGEDWTASATCGTPEQFNATGLGLRTTGEFGAEEAYLLPDKFAAEPSFDKRVVPSGSTPNLILVDPELSNAERTQISQSSDALDLMPIEE